MAARLGYVLYWFCCIISGLVVAIGAAIGYSEPKAQPLVVAVIAGAIALVVWLIGRAIRYVLAGT